MSNTPPYNPPFDPSGANQPPYMLAAWEKLNRQMLVPEGFGFYLIERIEGSDAIMLKGDVFIATKGKAKSAHKASGKFIQVVVVTRGEVNTYLANTEAAPLTDDEALDRVRALTEKLVEEANRLGVVVTIEKRQTVPLSMNGYELVHDVRKRR